MIDSINLYLPQSEIEEIDALAEIPNYLTEVEEHPTRNGILLKGRLSNLQVKVKEHGIYINGSLPKFLHGHNVLTSCLKDTHLAFEKLSDELRIRPEALDRAKVFRVDYAATIKVSSQVVDYFSYLGEKPFFNRSIFQETSLYYNSRAKERRNQKQKLLFYDKAEELKNYKDPDLTVILRFIKPPMPPEIICQFHNRINTVISSHYSKKIVVYITRFINH